MLQFAHIARQGRDRLVSHARGRARLLRRLPLQTPDYVQNRPSVLLSMMIAAVVIGVSILVILREGVGSPWLLLGFYVLYTIEQNVRVEKDTGPISAEEVIAYTAAVVLGPATLASLVLLRIVASCLSEATSVLGMVRMAGNISLMATGFAFAQLVLAFAPFGTVATTVLAVLAAVAGYILGEFVMCLRFALEGSLREWLPLVREHVLCRVRVVQHVGFVAAALPMTLAWSVEPWIVALVVVPLIVQYQTLRTEQRLQEAEQKIGVDPLTGLANRERFNVHVNSEIAAVERFGHQLGLIMGDLDNFKRVNDTLGHLSGDEVLRRTAAVFADVIASDARLLAARYGGEEFVVVATTLSHTELLTLSEELRQRVYDALHEEFGTSISLGFAYWTKGESAEQWIDRADKALYSAKMAGKNRVHEWPAGGDDAVPVRRLHAA